MRERVPRRGDQDGEIDDFQDMHWKLRGRLQVPAEAGEAELVAAAKQTAPLADLLSDKQIKRAIVVPGRLINLIVA